MYGVKIQQLITFPLKNGFVESLNSKMFATARVMKYIIFIYIFKSHMHPDGFEW